AYSANQLAHGQSAVTTWQYLGTTQFWFESMQNWQSEFIAVAAIVGLSIFLRQRGSAESKPVAEPPSRHQRLMSQPGGGRLGPTTSLRSTGGR
ncbi:MAG: hypothetical protein QOI25_9, partial [Mycobacterium sp.]|nr:hypothetical protein [Mycobacterium sp.]